MSSTLITNARMVNEGRTFDGDLRIENGRIAQIGSGLAPRDGEQVVIGGEVIEGKARPLYIYSDRDEKQTASSA